MSDSALEVKIDRPPLLVVAGPSGCGKSTRVNALGLKQVVSHTGRPMRDGEEDGVDYHFRTNEEMLELQEDGFFCEFFEVYGNYYGISVDELNKGEVLIVEMNGYRHVRDHLKVPTVSVLIKGNIYGENRKNFKEYSFDTNEFDYVLHNDTTYVHLQHQVHMLKNIYLDAHSEYWKKGIDTIQVIVAADLGEGIGTPDDELPWKIPSDLKRFRRETIGSMVVMGRVTYESLPGNLDKRQVVVVTSQENYEPRYPDHIVVNSVDDVLHLARSHDHRIINVVGGAQIYREFLNRRLVDKVLLTRVQEVCNNIHTYFPTLNTLDWWLQTCGGDKMEPGDQYATDCEMYTKILPKHYNYINAN